MRREYLIDGYNLIRSRPVGQRPKGPGNLHKERLNLLRWIGHRLADNDRATVVFDASSEQAKLAPRADPIQFGVHVIFADTYETADELIQELCREHTFPKQLVVVSNDRQIQRVARRRRAVPMPCDQFMYHLAKQARLREIRRNTPPEKPAKPAPHEREELSAAFDDESIDLPKDSEGDMFDFYSDMTEGIE